MPVTGWKLDETERAALLERFPPEWPDIIANHITLDAHASPDDREVQQLLQRLYGHQRRFQRQFEVRRRLNGAASPSHGPSRT